MALSDQIFLGFDPGGKSSFGAAMLAGQDVATTTVSTVAEALHWAFGQCGASVPIAVGVDTLLHWCDGPSGWRFADRWLRKTYPRSAHSIASANSLYGAMAVGGMALALRLRERWKLTLLNETHPKVLVPALGGEPYADAALEAPMAWFANHAGLDVAGVRGGHELDALLSAWATREGLTSGWTDLVGNDPALLFPAGRVSYLWPPIAAEDRKLEEPDQKSSLQTTGVGEHRVARRTTEIGYINKHQQEVTRKTIRPGNDHLQRVYVLRCIPCGHEYGSNGSDIWSRQCPKHDRGAPGLAC